MRIESKLKDISSFAVYYGANQENRMDKYDLLILEPKGHTRESITLLNKRGKITVAYVSVVEISKGDVDYLALAKDDFLKINGEVIVNQEYNTVYMDISKKNVQQLLLKRILTLLESSYAGIFLDTVGNIDFLNIDVRVKEELLCAAKLLVEKIKSAVPSAILIQNNGVVSVCEYTKNYIDAICFENPPCITLGNLKWTMSALKKLHGLKKEYNIKVFLLQERKSGKSRASIIQSAIKLYALL